jgi:tetratricopeptide (TPR) repeat protein
MRADWIHRARVRASSVLLAVVLSGSFVAAAPPQLSASQEIADASARVQAYVEQGSRHVDEGEWEAAREQFLKAWELLPHYRIAANLAEVELKLGLYREAAEHLSFVLSRTPSAEIEDIAFARTQLDQCKSHVAALDIRVNEAGATVRVNGRSVGVSPLETEVFVDPGDVEVTAELPGFERASRSFQVVSGAQKNVVLALTKSPADVDWPRPVLARAPLPTKPAAEQENTGGIAPRTWVLLSGGALTLTAAGVTLAYGLKYKARNDEATTIREELLAQDEQGTGAPCAPPPGVRPDACTELDGKLNERSAAANVANIAMASAVVLGGATLATYLVWPMFASGRPHASASATQEKRLDVAPQFGPGVGGVVVTGTF